MRLGLGVSIPGTSSPVQAAFSPLDLSPVLWLDAADTSTITEVGGAVSQWDDKSGNGNDVTQGTAAYQPSSGTRTLNSLNVLTFDGSDSLVNVSLPSVSAPYTTFIVFKLGTLDVATQYLLDSGNGNLQSILSTISTTNLRVGAGTYPLIGSGVDTTNTYVADWVINGASSEAKLNGVSTGTVNAGTNSRVGVRVGASTLGTANLRADGLVAEIIFYSGTVADADRLLVRQYLANKWGITL
jgi:hypothetical protein